jgi:hypothetical protein
MGGRQPVGPALLHGRESPELAQYRVKLKAAFLFLNYENI